MHIGTCKIKLYLPECQSLKEKRRVIKSLIARLRNRFNIGIAEIEALDVHQSTVLGAVSVANDIKHVQRIVSQTVKFIEKNPSVVMVDYETEFFY